MSVSCLHILVQIFWQITQTLLSGMLNFFLDFKYSLENIRVVETAPQQRAKTCDPLHSQQEHCCLINVVQEESAITRWGEGHNKLLTLPASWQMMFGVRFHKFHWHQLHNDSIATTYFIEPKMISITEDAIFLLQRDGSSSFFFIPFVLKIMSITVH